jgi:predicted nucleic acid-binding protein
MFFIALFFIWFCILLGFAVSASFADKANPKIAYKQLNFILVLITLFANVYSAVAYCDDGNIKQPDDSNIIKAFIYILIIYICFMYLVLRFSNSFGLFILKVYYDLKNNRLISLFIILLLFLLFFYRDLLSQLVLTAYELIFSSQKTTPPEDTNNIPNVTTKVMEKKATSMEPFHTKVDTAFDLLHPKKTSKDALMELVEAEKKAQEAKILQQIENDRRFALQLQEAEEHEQIWRNMEKLYREGKDYQFALQMQRDEENAVLQQIETDRKFAEELQRSDAIENSKITPDGSVPAVSTSDPHELAKANALLNKQRSAAEAATYSPWWEDEDPSVKNPAKSAASSQSTVSKKAVNLVDETKVSKK